MIYITLFLEFFKVGLFTIGGGLATLPFLYELADKFLKIDEINESAGRDDPHAWSIFTRSIV